MAEKRGQYVYNDDGTVAQLVSISGADSSGGAVGVTTGDILPMDKQAQLKQQIENNTTPLGASATYTGASFDTMADGINFTWLIGHAFANVAGNLHVEQSANGSDWERLDTIGLNPSTPAKVDIKILSRYVRFVLINGATAQTTLRLNAFVTFS